MTQNAKRIEIAVFGMTLLLVFNLGARTHGLDSNPYDLQVAEQIENLNSPSENVRAAGAEALGFLRAQRAAKTLEKALGDASPAVRREAAMTLAWCGGRGELGALLAALDDSDWVVRQAAWVALTNLTGMEWPFDSLADPAERAERVKIWREWVAAIPENKAPRNLIDMIQVAIPKSVENLALGKEVSASSTYKGHLNALTDGKNGPAFWQTKNVNFPQHCTVDLGRERKISCVVVQQYGDNFCMSDYALELSLDGKTFETVKRVKKKTPTRLTVIFPKRSARFVRVVAYGGVNPLYPTTFREVQVFREALEEDSKESRQPFLAAERALRALGALGGEGALEAILPVAEAYIANSGSQWDEKTMVQAGIRSLGRLGDRRSIPALTALLENPQWARYAADALGDFDDPEAALALIAAYPTYARDLKGAKPKASPPDDRPGLEPADRMYETPHAIASALARMSLSEPRVVKELRKIAPLLAANLPSDFDAAMLYEPEAHEEVTAYVLERAGLRRAALEAAFLVLENSSEKPLSASDNKFFAPAKRSQGGIPNAAHWLPALCKDREDIPRLIALLEHPNGWVRINAAKALAFLDAREAVEPMADLLAASKTEAEHGYNGRFFFLDKKHVGQSEYNDPPPRWRQAFARCLGRLQAKKHAPLLARLLWDERNVVEVQMACAQSLDELGTDTAIASLVKAEERHPFTSIRLFAREALWRRGLLKPETKSSPSSSAKASKPQTEGTESRGIVFIQGDNNMPNDFQIDHWRQTYSTTDSGPTYRLGKELMLLEEPRPDARVRPLTNFSDGFVSDCEVSWDGRRVVFAHRGGETDPWWHLFEINSDGSDLRQLTSGPYHDVQPAYLPDGRIVFSSSRIGMRDEYHGYYATGLTILDTASGAMETIGLNLGRDNEPAILPDGRIVFSRLELFYSRMKTELTVHAVFPDGTHDVTLYGPERRDLWRKVTIQSKEKWWGEVPPRHRVLRLTQPQPYGQGQVLCATTAGLTLTGPGRYRETMGLHPKDMAVTSPFPLPDGRILCAATSRTFVREEVDLGLYYLDPLSGEMTLLYNDPKKAEFEPRPLAARIPPPKLADNPASFSNEFTARFACRSIRSSQEDRVGERGKLLRVVEGQPSVARHHSHLSSDGPAWKNHTGTHARVLGTVPLAADGSFYVEVPADRLIHVQVLDSDRRVVGNQQIWMYGRPGESRSCVGCHERPDTASPMLERIFPAAVKQSPLPCLPTGGEFSYRAKFWNKGTLSDEGEERTRTVRAVNLLARY